MAVEVRKVTKSITAANVFTDPIRIKNASPGEYDRINVSISGTFVATVTVQRSFNGGPFFDVEQFTSPVERIAETFEQGVDWRVGVKPGDFTFGPVEVRLSF